MQSWHSDFLNNVPPIIETKIMADLIMGHHMTKLMLGWLHRATGCLGLLATDRGDVIMVARALFWATCVIETTQVAVGPWEEWVWRHNLWQRGCMLQSCWLWFDWNVGTFWSDKNACRHEVINFVGLTKLQRCGSFKVVSMLQFYLITKLQKKQKCRPFPSQNKAGTRPLHHERAKLF